MVRKRIPNRNAARNSRGFLGWYSGRTGPSWESGNLDHSQPAIIASPASAAKDGASNISKFRLKIASSTDRRKYIMPEAITVAPANKCGRFSRAALLAKTTVVTVDE